MDLKQITQQDEATLAKVAAKLRDLYKVIPDTEGCMENIQKAEGGCGAWCCQHQSPQLLHCEFVNAWKWVADHWSKDEMIQLIAAALRNFLNNSKNKGCIFWDRGTRLCRQHETRPLACRTYGVMPEDEWKPRYEKLKVINPDLRPQCDLIKTVNGKALTKQQTDIWWKMLVQIEADVMRIPRSRINDKAGGTYRTFHDHIMLALYDREKLSALSKMRLTDTEEQKERFVQLVVRTLSGKVQDVTQKTKEASQENPPEQAEEKRPEGPTEV